MSSVLTNYERFLLTKFNGPTISTIESALRTLSWLLPGRFKDAELASEFLTSTLNLLSLYHHYIVSLLLRSNPNLKFTIPPSLRTRYTRAWADKDFAYKWCQRILNLLRSVELVVEMTLHRKVSDEVRWRGVLVMEMMKATLRLALLRITRRPALTTSIPDNDIDSSSLILPPEPAPLVLPDAANTIQPLPQSTESKSNVSFAPSHLQNNRVPLEDLSKLLSPPPTPSPHAAPLPDTQITRASEEQAPEQQVIQPAHASTTIDDYLLSRALTTTSVKHPTSLMRKLSSPKDWLSEVLFILRPLVYVYTLRRQLSKTNKQQSWHDVNPLIVSLTLELLSRYTRRAPTSSSSLEISEYGRRDRDMFWYLFRGSIWQEYTRPKLEAVADATMQKPLFAIVGGLIKAWVPLIDEYYYYTAT